MNFDSFNSFKKKNIENSAPENDIAENIGFENKQSNPIIPSGLISKINAINNRTTSNRLYAGYNHKTWRTYENIDYQEVIKFINEVTRGKESQNEMFYSLHNIFTNKLNAVFSAFGLYQQQTNSINFKIIDKIGSTFTCRVLLNGSDNPVEKAFNTQTTIYEPSNKFLNVHYLTESAVAIIPLCAVNTCIGVMMIGDNNYESTSEIYKLMSNYLALFIQNKTLSAKVLLNTDTDALTGLYNHRKFQEILGSLIMRN